MWQTVLFSTLQYCHQTSAQTRQSQYSYRWRKLQVATCVCANLQQLFDHSLRVEKLLPLEEATLSRRNQCVNEAIPGSYGHSQVLCMWNSRAHTVERVKTWWDMGMGHLWCKWVRHLQLRWVRQLWRSELLFFGGDMLKNTLVFRGVLFLVIEWPQVVNSWPMAYYRKGGTTSHLSFALWGAQHFGWHSYCDGHSQCYEYSNY